MNVRRQAMSRREKILPDSNRFATIGQFSASANVTAPALFAFHPAGFRRGAGGAYAQSKSLPAPVWLAAPSGFLEKHVHPPWIRRSDPVRSQGASVDCALLTGGTQSMPTARLYREILYFARLSLRTTWNARQSRRVSMTSASDARQAPPDKP